MANQRNGVPAGWQWRDGRPRWIPSPTLRKAGWKGADLKDAKGAWLAKGPSIERAEAIVGAVAAWRAGAAVPADCAAFAPTGAIEARGLGPAAAPDPFSIGALFDDFLASDELRLKDGKPRAPKTISDYSTKLKRLVDALAGYPTLPQRPARTGKGRHGEASIKPEDAARYAAELKRYEAAVAEVRAMPIYTLEPEEIRDPVTGKPKILAPLYDAYWALHHGAGVHMASGVLAVASTCLDWCRRFRSRSIQNWAKDVERVTPPGRIVTYDWPEVRHLVRTADKIGMAWVGDAIVLAFDLSWSQIDVLSLTWDRIRDGRAIPHNTRLDAPGRVKTGHVSHVGGTTLTSLSKARLEQIRRRNAAAGVSSVKVIRIPRERIHRKALAQDSESNYFRKAFDAVRAKAAQELPSLKEKTFADLRDTAFTWGKEAGMDNAALSSRTLQSLQNIDQLADDHYGQITATIADQAAAMLEALYRKRGVAL